MSKQAWDNYWASGLHSCFPKDGIADTELKLVWNNAIKQLALKEHPQLLELGCGNGFLTEIIIASLTHIRHTLNVMDYSQVQLEQVLASTQYETRVFQNTAIEQMPFDDASMDLVFANFSFEYVDTDKAIQQVSRVLSTGGQFLFNIHAKNSSVSAVSTNVCSGLQQMLQSKYLFANISEIVRLKLQSTDAAHKAEITAIARSIIDELRLMDISSNGGIGSSGFIEDILPIINTSNSMVSFPQLESIWESYRLYQMRIQQQLGVGYDSDSIKTLVKAFNQYSIDVDVKPINIDGKLFSYMIQGVRRGG
jgi:ubiquinone/menaquinone biosynthesis C-methylase UbiE